MTVTVLLQLKAKPGEGSNLADAMDALLPDTRAYQGCLGADLMQGLDDRDDITLIERWEQRQDHEAYSAWRNEQGSLAAIAPLLGGRPTVTYYVSPSGVS
jgi:quinol monooxygenase YgiN